MCLWCSCLLTICEGHYRLTFTWLLSCETCPETNFDTNEEPQNDSCHETAGKIVFSQAKGLKKGLVTENKITTTNHTWG